MRNGAKVRRCKREKVGKWLNRGARRGGNEEALGAVHPGVQLPARFISIDDAVDCVSRFLFTPFEGGRHEDRVKTIEKI